MVSKLIYKLAKSVRGRTINDFVDKQRVAASQIDIEIQETMFI